MFRLISVFLIFVFLSVIFQQGESFAKWSYKLVNVDFASTNNVDKDFLKCRYFCIPNRKDEFSKNAVEILESKGFKNTKLENAKSFFNLYIVAEEVKEKTEIPYYIKNAKPGDFLVYVIVAIVDAENKSSFPETYLWNIAVGGIMKPYPDVLDRDAFLSSYKQELIKKLFDKYIPDISVKKRAIK